MQFINVLPVRQDALLAVKTANLRAAGQPTLIWLGVY